MLRTSAHGSAWPARARDAILCCLLLAACDDPGWVLSSEAAAAAQATAYDDAPSWDDGIHCAGALTAGAVALGDSLVAMFPQIDRVYGYECRFNTAFPEQQSQHGTGRAIDLAIPVNRGEADNAQGDPIANWLVEHSTEIGVQLVIWDRTLWIGTKPDQVQDYDGPNPHVDHLHVELTIAASLQQTPFFAIP